MNEGALERRAQLVAVSNELTSAFSRLYRSTTPHDCDDLAQRLTAAAAFVGSLKDALRGDNRDPGDLSKAARPQR